MKDITTADLFYNMPLVTSDVNKHRKEFICIGGPCTVEEYVRTHCIASLLKTAGVKYFRGGAYKPLTFPYRNESMFELREEGLEILSSIRDELDMKIVTEVVDVRLVDRVAEVADILQIGSRNMYNYPLLEECAMTEKRILLKRHFGASLRDWLGAAEYILNRGNNQVILCERGIAAPHTHNSNARFIADINVIPYVRKYTQLPVIIDPSHATFNRDIVASITYAGVAAGANGAIIETHTHPEQAAVDKLNAVPVSECIEIFNKAKQIRKLLK